MSAKEYPYILSGLLMKISDEEFKDKETNEVKKMTRMKIGSGSFEGGDAAVYDFVIMWKDNHRPKYLDKAEQGKPFSMMARVRATFDGKNVEVVPVKE